MCVVQIVFFALERVFPILPFADIVFIHIKLKGLSQGTPDALDLSLSLYIWEMYKNNVDKGGVRVGFIYIKDMYNNDVGKGVVYAYEAYEAK